MSLIVSLLLVTVFAGVCQRPLAHFPALFYVLALLVCIVGIYFTLSPHSSPAVRTITFAIQKGHLGFAFFTVVMFIGVLGHSSSARRYLTPVRAQFSIIAGILIVGHLTPYLGNYLAFIPSLFSLRPSIASSLVIALILLVLLALLVVTSFNAVKKMMDAGKWKTVQKLAYPFFGLVFFHLLGYLMIPVLSGSTSTLVNLTVYCVVFALYVILRIRRAVLDKHALVGVATNGTLNNVS